jgi:hypothetical protein
VVAVSLKKKSLECTAESDNEAARRPYRHVSIEVACEPRANSFRGGAYVDSHIMARLKVAPAVRQEKTVAVSRSAAAVPLIVRPKAQP